MSKSFRIPFYKSEFHILSTRAKSYFKQKFAGFSMAIRQHFWINILILFLTLPFIAEAQDYANKTYYLVDSLKLDDLHENDRDLLDSALTLYHKAINDTVRCNAIFLITQGMTHEDWSKYNEFLYIKLHVMMAGSSLTEEESLYGKRLLANVMGDLGFYAASVQGDFNNALDYFHNALDLSEEIGDKYNMITMLNNIGSASERFGDIPRALECYHKGLMLCEELDYIKGMPSFLNNIGLTNMKQGNYPEALDFLTKSLKIHDELQDHKNVAKNLENIGLIYSRTGNSEKAMSYMFRSLQTAEKIGDKITIARALKSVAAEYIIQDSLDNAKRYSEKALTVYESLGNKRGLASVYLLFSEIALKKGNLKKANTYASQSLQLAQELGFPDDIRNAALLSSSIYQEDREFEEGLKMYKLYISMRDSILNISTRKSTIVQQTKYEIEKATLIKQQAEKEVSRISSEKQKRRHNFQYAIILIVLLVFFVGIALMGKIKLGPGLTQAFIYLAILILFESTLVIADPFVEEIANGEPGWKLLANVGIALLLFPFHTLLDKRLKKRIKKNNKTILSKP